MFFFLGLDSDVLLAVRIFNGWYREVVIKNYQSRYTPQGTIDITYGPRKCMQKETPADRDKWCSHLSQKPGKNHLISPITGFLPSLCGCPETKMLKNRRMMSKGTVGERNPAPPTLPETNIAPENGPSQKETSIPTTNFQGLC